LSKTGPNNQEKEKLKPELEHAEPRRIFKRLAQLYKMTAVGQNDTMFAIEKKPLRCFQVALLSEITAIPHAV